MKAEAGRSDHSPHVRAWATRGHVRTELARNFLRVNQLYKMDNFSELEG